MQFDTPLQAKSVFLKSSQYTSQLGVSNYEFVLNEPVKCLSNMDIYMNLDSFQFTNSFYTINDYNNTFAYEIENLGSFTTTITQGFYGIPKLTSLLNTTFLNVFVFTYNIYTYKFTVICGSQFKILYHPMSCFDVLGFNKEGDDVFSLTKIAPRLFNTMAVQQLKVCCGNLRFESVGLKGVVEHNILCALRVNVPVGNIQNFYNVSNFAYQILDDNISSLNIYILDQNNNLVDFNGIEWFANINFNFAYKKKLISPLTIGDDYKMFSESAYDYLLQERIDQQNELIDEYIDENHLLPPIKNNNNINL
jgi:hypothetical protein